MADSDEDYERKRRDKFRRERNDYQERREYKNRDDWEERPRNNWRNRGGGGGYIKRDNHFRGDFERKRPRFENHDDKEPSPTNAPPKRFRRDWDNQHYNKGGAQGYNHGYFDYAPVPQPPPMAMPIIPKIDPETCDVLMSYKQFLLNLSDNTTIEDSITRYKKYMLDFQKIATSEFFSSHKDEEWFKNKYHPEESIAALKEKIQKVMSRQKLFAEFNENGWIDNISLNQDHIKDIVKFLDAIIIKLEGGSDADLKILEEEYASKSINPEDIIDKNIVSHNTPSTHDLKNVKAIKQKIKKEKKEDKPILSSNGLIMNDDDLEDIDKLDFEVDGDFNEKETGELGKDTNKAAKKSPQSSRSSSCSSSSSGSTSRSASSASTNKSNNNAKKLDANRSPAEEGETKDDEEKIKGSDDHLPLHKTTSIFLRNLPPTITKSEIENLCKDYEGYLRVALADPLPDRKFYRRGWVTFNNTANIKKICATLASIRVKDCEMGPIVNRDITRRVRLVNGIVVHKPIAINDLFLAFRCILMLDNKYKLFQHDDEVNGNDNIKSSHSAPDKSLNDSVESVKESDTMVEEESSDKLNDTDMVVQDVLKVENDEIVIEEDSVSNVKKVIADEDENSRKLGEILSSFKELTDLYSKGEGDIKTADLDKMQFSLVERLKNPFLREVIQNFTNYLKGMTQFVNISEKDLGDISPISMSPKDSELNGKKELNLNQSTVPHPDIQTVERDEGICKILDKMILYLRLVHSLDYYSVSDYPNEDDMPNKCGIIHCRGSLIQDKILLKDVQDWLKNFQAKIDAFLAPPYISLEDAIQIGIREKKPEIEKFIKENTQELSKDKWLCPLSGKKFKGPEFVHKHILNKHPDKLENVKIEVDYFNYFVLDPRRPHTNESAGSATVIGGLLYPGPGGSVFTAANTSDKNGLVSSSSKGNKLTGPPPYVNSYLPFPPAGYFPPPPYVQPVAPGRGSYEAGDKGSFNRRNGPGFSRNIVKYEDLDAPEETNIIF